MPATLQTATPVGSSEGAPDVNVVQYVVIAGLTVVTCASHN